MRYLARIGAAAAMLLAFALSSAAWAAEVVILESTLASFTPGQAVPGETRVTLKAGDLINVLTADGQTQIHNGPYDGPLANSASNGWSGSLSVVSSLIGEAEAERKRLGATRAFGKDDRPDVNYIDVSSTDVFCVKETSAIHFWRPSKMDVDSDFSLSSESFGPQPLSGFWLGGDRTLQWPPGLPIPFGTTLQMRLNAKGVVSEVDLVRIPSSVEDGFSSIVWMARQGCKTQALRLLESLRTAG